MIGEVRKIITPWYNSASKRREFKSRPCLILKEMSGDYAVLPVSSISHQENIDANYDVFVTTDRYPKLNLTRNSYIRTNKMTVANTSEIGDKIGDLAGNYPELLNVIIDKISSFNTEIIQTLKELCK